jgi:hypothetical protein
MSTGHQEYALTHIRVYFIFEKHTYAFSWYICVKVRYVHIFVYRRGEIGTIFATKKRREKEQKVRMGVARGKLEVGCEIEFTAELSKIVMCKLFDIKRRVATFNCRAASIRIWNSRLPDFSWYKLPKREKYTKLPRTKPNVDKIKLKTVKWTKCP